MIRELEEKIIAANEAYRTGYTIDQKRDKISDSEYDSLLEKLSEIDPQNKLLYKIGHSIVDDTRKSKLPIEMASMNKCKTIEEIFSWAKNKRIPLNESVVLSPKFDGLSLCVDEKSEKAWSRGDGEVGQKSDEHYKYIKNKFNGDTSSLNYTYGEVMMSKETFLSKYSSEFENPRNLVAGRINSKTISPILNDCLYIKYGAIFDSEIFNKKSDVFEFLNKGQESKVKYYITTIKDLTEDMMVDLFKSWSTEYEIDGIIIEINNLFLQKELGRETSSKNPVWARAFKSPKFEQSAITDVIGISWNISKNGLLKPIIHVSPVRLDGVTVSNVTGNNAKFIKDMGIGIGSTIKIIRSGMVIPKVIEVTKKVDFQMPNIPNIDWNENGIELISLVNTDDQQIKKIISFFEILEADNVGEGVINQLWDAGYTTIKDILNLKKAGLEKIDRFGKRKSEIVFNSIKKSITGVELCKLQHASGIFVGLGSKKLRLLNFDSKPNIGDIISIEGFAETSAISYIDGYDKFNDFIKDLPITISKSAITTDVPKGKSLDGKSFVFTGVRDKDIEVKIESNGGKISSGVSKSTTHLIMKQKGSGSSKENKAIELGIEIMTLDELKDYLNNK